MPNLAIRRQPWHAELDALRVPIGVEDFLASHSVFTGNSNVPAQLIGDSGAEGL